MMERVLRDRDRPIVLVVAERVETEDQLAFLMENGCDQAQGYFISEPLPRDALIDLLDEWKSLDLKMFR